jgi:CubicO group peptidase (beta-lactamase class C family)
MTIALLGSNRYRGWHRFTLALLWIVAAAPTIASAQDKPESKPPSAAATAEDELSSLVAQLDAHIEQVRQEWDVPGLAVAVVQDDRVVLSRGYGHLRQGEPTRVDEHTLFAIASNTKAFTAAALAILVDEGKLDWDDRVRDYLPWLQLRDPLATAELRIRDLLCHRSGLGTFSGDLVWWGTDYSPRQVLERARHLEPASSFRSAYGYSNLMFLAAGLVIEEVSGMPYGQFVEQRILEPLEMRRTITSVRDLVAQGNFATPHKTSAAGTEPVPWVNWDTMVAAGGLISSAADMAQWLRLQLNRGRRNSEQPLFSESQAREMWKSHTPIPVSESYRERFPSTHFRSYGLGWSMSNYRGHKMVGHGGGYDGMYSRVLMVPGKKLGVVVLTNSMTGIAPALAYHIVDRLAFGEPSRDWSGEARKDFQEQLESRRKRVAEVLEPAAADTSPSHPLEDYTGTYRDELYGDLMVELEDERLVIRFTPNPDLIADLEHLHYDTFIMRWRKESAWFDEGTVTFNADSRGRLTSLLLDVPNDDLWFYELHPVRVNSSQ